MRLPGSEARHFPLEKSLDVTVHTLTVIEVSGEAHFLVACPVREHDVAQIAHKVDGAFVLRAIRLMGLDEATAVRKHGLHFAMRSHLRQDLIYVKEACVAFRNNLHEDKTQPGIAGAFERRKQHVFVVETAVLPPCLRSAERTVQTIYMMCAENNDVTAVATSYGIAKCRTKTQCASVQD